MVFLELVLGDCAYLLQYCFVAGKQSTIFSSKSTKETVMALSYEIHDVVSKT